jgi:hypothetical protein
MQQTTFLPSRSIKVDESRIVEPDICRNRHGGVTTSMLADRHVRKIHDRRMVLGFITAAGQWGHTLDEVSVLTDRAPNRLSGRITELLRHGQIAISDRVRQTRTGSLARVYVAVRP